MRLPVAAALVALVCATFAAPGVAFADAKADLEKAHNAYVAHQYEEAESRLRALLDPATTPLKDPDNIADARMYLGAVLLAEKKTEEAAAVFDALYLARQDYEPDPLRVSLEAIDAFTDAKGRNREKALRAKEELVRKAQEQQAKLETLRQKQALRLTMLEKLATTEVVVERHSRWLALVPFGVGQFQNGQTADGWIFLVGEGLLAVSSVVAGGFAYYYEGQAWSAYQRRDQAAQTVYANAGHWAAITDDLLVGGLVLTALGGIVHAQATFVPEKVETRKREIPALSLSPVIGPGGIGVVGRF